MSENQPLHSARTAYDAVIFDMDGVVTDTASVHARAWKALFDEVLPRLSTTPVQPFDADTDYRRYVDGRPREDGIRTFLASRGIDASRMRTISYGKERPVAVCNDISCWSQNRRAVTVLNASS